MLNSPLTDSQTPCRIGDTIISRLVDSSTVFVWLIELSILQANMFKLGDIVSIRDHWWYWEVYAVSATHALLKRKNNRSYAWWKVEPVELLKLHERPKLTGPQTAAWEARSLLYAHRLKEDVLK